MQISQFQHAGVAKSSRSVFILIKWELKETTARLASLLVRLKTFSTFGRSNLLCICHCFVGGGGGMFFHCAF